MRPLLPAVLMLLAMVALLAPENARAQSDEEKASAQLQALRSDISRINREISSANKRKNTFAPNTQQ